MPRCSSVCWAKRIHLRVQIHTLFPLTDWVLVQVPIVGSVAMLYYKHVRRLSTRLRDLDGEMQAFAQARLANVRTVRAFANETLEAKRFQQVPCVHVMLREPRECALAFFSVHHFLDLSEISPS